MNRRHRAHHLPRGSRSVALTLVSAVLLSGVLLSSVLFAPPASAGEWGEYDDKCAKIDQEWKDQISLAKRIYETMKAANQEYENSGKKDVKAINKWHGKVSKAAAGLLKWLEKQQKAHAKAWNAEFIVKHELDPAVDLLSRKMEKIKEKPAKNGKFFKNGWSQGINGIPYSRMQAAREGALAAAYCFYDLKTGKDIYDFEEWKTIEGAGL